MSAHLPYLELKQKYDDLSRELQETRCILKTKTRSEMKYRLMTESSSHHLITVDFSGNIIASNMPFNEVNQEELAGNSIYKYIHSSSMGALKKCFEFVRKTGKRAKLKTMLVGNNGKCKNYEAHISPVFISNIVAAFCLSMFICPKEKKQPKRPQIDIENFWPILEHTDHGWLFQKSDGTFTKANKAALEMIGCSPDHLIGKKIPDLDWEVIDVENPSLCDCQKQSVDFSNSHGLDRHSMGNASTIVGFYNPRRKNNIRLTIHAVSSGDDGHVCNICILQDITHKDEMTEKYEQLLMKYHSALNKIKRLDKLMRICSNCKKIFDDEEGWTQLESFFEKYSNIKFSHGLCQECSENLYPQFKVYEGKGLKSSQ
jgi:PAS domain S-box-containing protein